MKNTKNLVPCFLLLVVILTHWGSQAQILGPANSSIPTTGITFTGTDGATLCKACQIPCTESNLFEPGSCQSPYYRYGCHLQSPCLTTETANLLQFHAAVSFCIAYNGCKLLSLITKPSDYTMFYPLQSFQVSVAQLMKTNPQDSIFTADDPKQAAKDFVKNRLNSFANNYKLRESSLKTSCQKKLISVSTNDKEFDKLQDLCDKMVEKVEKAAEKADEMVYSEDSYSAITAFYQEQYNVLMNISSTEYKKVLRDMMLDTLTPSIPGALYLYYKLTQDFKDSNTYPRQLVDQINDNLPPWFKNMLEYEDLEEYDFKGVKTQLRSSDGTQLTRLDNMFNWVNEFAETYATDYVTSLIEMTRLNTLLEEEYVGLFDTSFVYFRLPNSVDTFDSHPEWDGSRFEGYGRFGGYSSGGARFSKTRIDISQEQYDILSSRNKKYKFIEDLKTKMNEGFTAQLTKFATESNLKIEQGLDEVFNNAKDVFFSTPSKLNGTVQTITIGAWDAQEGLPYAGYGRAPDTFQKLAPLLTTVSDISDSTTVVGTSVRVDDDGPVESLLCNDLVMLYTPMYNQFLTGPSGFMTKGVNKFGFTSLKHIGQTFKIVCPKTSSSSNVQHGQKIVLLDVNDPTALSSPPKYTVKFVENQQASKTGSWATIRTTTKYTGNIVLLSDNVYLARDPDNANLVPYTKYMVTFRVLKVGKDNEASQEIQSNIVRCADVVYILNSDLLFLTRNATGVEFRNPQTNGQSFTIGGSCIGKEGIKYGSKIQLITSDGQSVNPVDGAITLSSPLVNDGFLVSPITQITPADEYVRSGSMLYIGNTLLLLERHDEKRPNTTTILCGDWVGIAYNFTTELVAEKYTRIYPYSFGTSPSTVFRDSRVMIGGCTFGTPITTTQTFTFYTSKLNPVYFVQSSFVPQSNTGNFGPKFSFSETQYSTSLKLLAASKDFIPAYLQIMFFRAPPQTIVHNYLLSDDPLECPPQKFFIKVGAKYLTVDPTSRYTSLQSFVGAGSLFSFINCTDNGPLRNFALETVLGTYLCFGSNGVLYHQNETGKGCFFDAPPRSDDLLDLKFIRFPFHSSIFPTSTSLGAKTVGTISTVGTGTGITMNVIRFTSAKDGTDETDSSSVALFCGDTITLATINKDYLTYDIERKSYYFTAALDIVQLQQWRIRQTEKCNLGTPILPDNEVQLESVYDSSYILSMQMDSKQYSSFSLQSKVRGIISDGFTASLRGKNSSYFISATPNRVDVEATVLSTFTVNKVGLPWCTNYLSTYIKIVAPASQNQPVVVQVTSPETSYITVGEEGAEIPVAKVNAGKSSFVDISTYFKDRSQYLRLTVYSTYKCNQGSTRVQIFDV